MIKALILLILFSSTICIAKSDQITLTYSVERPNTKKLSYWSLYVDTLNEKVSEVVSNNFKDILFVITYDKKMNEVRYIDYTKMIIFEANLKKNTSSYGTPLVKYIRKNDCTLYLYRKEKVSTQAKCFKERSKYFQFKEVNKKKYTDLLLSYIDIMDDPLLKLPLYDSVMSYEIIKVKEGEIRMKLKKLNFQTMGRNGLNLPTRTYLTRVKKQDCFRLKCFGIKD